VADTPRKNSRTRPRTSSLAVDREAVVQRVKDFYDTDRQAMDLDRDARLQRAAKLRMWTSGKDWPWPNSSDIGLPLMMEASLRMQDTLHNAFMSQRPPITPTALQKGDKQKEEQVNKLIDYQVFIENAGEKIVGDSADAFVNDGNFVIFIPWVKEEREVVDTRVYDPLPDNLLPAEYFQALLAVEFPDGIWEMKANGWDYDMRVGDKKVRLRFYTRPDGRVELLARRDVETFNGPRLIVKDYEDVLSPSRCENLQPPSPANPMGAARVIMIDRPTIDEVKRLVKSGFYDLATSEQLSALTTARTSSTDEQEKEQKDAFQGQTPASESKEEPLHRTITRLTCFDTFDIDDDGLAEDVIWWVLPEQDILLKAKMMTEMYPSNPPRRPFAEAAFIPVRSRRQGIGLPELIEGLHDTIKKQFDQMVDAGDLALTPFGAYRSSSAMNPEIKRIAPGELIPLADPQRDIAFPRLDSGQGERINLITMLNQMGERLTEIGAIQHGRVPEGGSSALRTIGGMALLAGQGEARPERILRRFFIGWTEAWTQIHELNKAFLPKGKQFRMVGAAAPGEDPYEEITDQSQIAGRYQFEFKANVLNTTKAALQQSLDALIQVLVTPLAIEMGVVNPENLYRLFKDWASAHGQDATAYLNPPTPRAPLPLITAEQAAGVVMQGSMPVGTPTEGALQHLMKIMQFKARAEQGGELQLDPSQMKILDTYIQQIEALAMQEAQQQALVQAAQQFAQGRQQAGGQPGRPAQGPPVAPQTPQVSGGNELLNESLPGAGGGANQ